MHLATGLAKSSVISFAGNVIGNASEFATQIFLIRLLGQEEFGRFTFGLTVLLFLSAWSLFGTGEGLGVFLPRLQASDDRATSRRVLQAGIAVVLMMVLAGAALLGSLGPVVLRPWLRDTALIPIVQLVAVVGIGHIASNHAVDMLRGLRKTWMAVLVRDVIGRFGRFCSVILCTWMWPSAQTALTAYSLAGVAALAWALVVMRRDTGVILGRVPWIEVRALMSFGWPLMLADLLGQMCRRVEILILPLFLSTGALGIYGGAVLLPNLISMPLAAVNVFFLPYATDILARAGKRDFRQLFGLEGRWLFYLLFPVLILFLRYPGDLLAAIFGEPYRSAADVLRILSLGAFVNIATASCGLALIAYGHNKIHLLLRPIGAVASAACCFLLIPRMGVEGAAIGNSLGMMAPNLASVLLLAIWHRTQPYSWNYLIYAAVGVLGFWGLDAFLRMFVEHNAWRGIATCAVLSVAAPFLALVVLERRPALGTMTLEMRRKVLRRLGLGHHD